MPESYGGVSLGACVGRHSEQETPSSTPYHHAAILGVAACSDVPIWACVGIHSEQGTQSSTPIAIIGFPHYVDVPMGACVAALWPPCCHH